MPDYAPLPDSHTLCMGASRLQAGWVIGGTLAITAGTVIYILMTVPSRSQAIQEAVRPARRGHGDRHHAGNHDGH